jgi:hypothetical protein
MKITLESTKHVVELLRDGAIVKGRVWQGYTDSGIYVQALIVRVAVDGAADQKQFESELEETKAPQAIDIFPARMVM